MSWLSGAVTSIAAKSNLGRKGLISAYSSQVTHSITDGGIFSTGVPFPQVTLVYVEVTKI